MKLSLAILSVVTFMNVNPHYTYHPLSQCWYDHIQSGRYFSHPWSVLEDF